MPESHPYAETGPIFENRPEINIADPYTLLLDQNVSFVLETNRPATNFSASGLPSGLSLDSSTGEVSGYPSALGTYLSNLEATNYAGTLSRQVFFEVKDFSQWPFSLKIDLDGYSGSSTIGNFPLFLELNDSISGFSYEQFVSSHGHDLRFLTGDQSEEIPYEVVEWNPNGISSFWVLLPELAPNTSIYAIWGILMHWSNLPIVETVRCGGKYHGVWHMDGNDDEVVRDSRNSFHATPYNIEELRVPGVMGSAINFDGVNDYLDMSLDAHPPDGTTQLTISFWSYGRFATLTDSTLFESGSVLGRHLNVHYPWSNSRFYWDAGSGTYDRVEKEDSNYLGAWMYWTLQKDVDLGIMRIYKNGTFFAEAFNRTRPLVGQVDSFRIGSARAGGAWWKGWLDEFRIGLFIETPDSILASYSNQNPNAGGGFSSFDSVQGPPIILRDQIAEGFANDANQSFEYLVKTFPQAQSFSIVGLPPGLDFNQSTGRIAGVPLQGGVMESPLRPIMPMDLIKE